MTIYLKVNGDHIKYSDVELLLVETYHVTLRLKSGYTVKTPYLQKARAINILQEYNISTTPFVHIFNKDYVEILSIYEQWLGECYMCSLLMGRKIISNGLKTIYFYHTLIINLKLYSYERIKEIF